MPPITVSTEVERSAEDVFAYATDPTRFPEWQQGVIDGHMDQPGVPAVGARCLTTRRIGGANRSSTSEVAHISPPATWGVRGIDGPIRAIVDVTVEPLTARRSRLTIEPVSSSCRAWSGSGLTEIHQGLSARSSA